MFEDSSWNALCLLEKNEEKLLFINGGNSSAVYGFSSDTHELIDLYTANEGDRITAMDAIILDDVNPIFLYGIAKSDGRGGIILRKNWSLMKNQIEVDGEVKDVKFTPRNDYAICCTAMGSVYVFKQQDGSLDRASAKVINIDREIRISINFCDKGSDVILTTEQRKHYKMNVESCDKMEEIDEKDPFNMSIASLVYHNQHLYFPVIIGQELEYIVSMRGEAMEFWKGLKDLETNCGIKAYGHASEISRIQVSNSKDNVYSLGRSDNCLIEWKVTYDLSAKAQKKDFLNMNISPKRDVDRNVRFLSGADDSKDPNKINRELSFCLNQGERTLNFRDSFTLFRGNTVKLLNALHYKEKSDFDEKNYLYKRVPEVAITLSHVYGIEAFSRRKTLFFLHYYSVSDKNRVTDPTQTGPQAEVKDVILPENYLKEMLFSKYTPIPYDQKHQNCERYMAYFCSRVAIVSKCTTGDLRQKFYEGHRARISCMAVHPSKLIVATGEAELNAEIHVWSMIDCCLMKKTISAHTNGVINLSFSFDGLYLISIGTTGKNYNIQVANWRAGEIIAEVQASTEPILDLIVNPYNRELFSTCGKNRIQTWKLLDRTLIVEQNVEIPVTENSASTYITALSYIYYLPGDMIVTDLIVGNSKGDLGIVTCGKFIPLEKGAHKGMINNIKITDVIHDKLTIITTGEDEYVRFWDIQVKLVSEYSVRQLFPETGNLDGASEKNISVQSIDIFACKPPPTMIVDGQLTTGYEKENPVLLLGTRNGTIIEISLSSEFKKLQAAPGEMGRDIEKPGDVYEKKETYQEIKKIIFHARIIMNNHASQQQNTTDILSQRKIRFTVHPKQPIMVSSGADNDIMFWSTRTHKSRSSITLKSKATCIKFSPNGDYLCIGYENDKLEIISISFENKKPGDDESDMPAQKIVQRINEPQTYILNIEFSESSKQLAVSYLNKKEPEEGEKRITGYVNVFLLNSKYRDTLKNKEDLYIKYRTINSTASDSNLSTNIFYGCYYMSFSANEEYIIINFQQIDKNINKENDDKEKKYVIWDLKNNAPQDNIDLLSRETASGKLNFPNHVNAIYRYHEKYLEKSPDMALTDKQESLTSSKNLTISAMQYFDKFLFFGSGKGDISVVKDYCLQVPPNMTVESLRLDQYFLAKSYAAHCSAIENIEISDDKQKLFTSSASDEVIFEWTIKKGEPEWELDHTVYDLNMEDMFLREVEMREEHKKIITEMLEPRNQIIELQQNIDTKVEPEISLKLEKIIGRKAFNRRNNVYYTANNHLIFSAASLLVMIDIPPEGMDITPETKNQFFKEKFLEVDRGDADSTSPEISTFTLSPDRRYVCAGTIQKKAKLITWELTTNTFIKSWTLENCCVVLNIRYSSDKKRLVCIALTETYMQVVMLIDNATGEILGSTEFSYSIPFRIKDVDFLPKSNDEFVTIGFQHLSKWKLKGGLITFVELPIENPREMISKAGVLHVIQERKHRLLKKNLGPSIVNNVETFPLEVTFMSLIFLFDELMITAGDDGFLYIWKNDVIIQKKNAHLNSTIYCLCASKFHPNLFVSGGMDGCVNLWEMRSPSNESLYIVEKIFEYNLAGDNLETTLQNPSCHIQTLQFRFNKIIAGTRSGDIYFLALPAAAEIKSTAKESKSLQMKVYTAHDHEIPKDVDFDSNCSRIFCITERGLFSSWSFNTLELLYQQKFDFQATAMTVLKSRPYIILTFEKKIIVLNVQERESAPEIPSFALEVKQATSDTSVNFDEKMIAVAMAPSDNSNPVINIYTINYTRNQFELYYVIKEISSTILFMDFSNDNVYLQYMDENFNKFYLDLKDKIQSEKLDLENIEWVSEGLKISDKRSGLDPCYTEENKVTCLVRAGRNSIIAADEIGTIRIFEYPCKSTEYYRIYSHHLSFIRTLHVSKNGDYLVSSSSRDKCIFIWRIHYDNRREGENIQESFQDESNDEY